MYSNHITSVLLNIWQQAIVWGVTLPLLNEPHFDITAAKKKHSAKKHDERKRRERLLELEKEETSSTTTESSGVDADDKVHIVSVS